MGRENWGNRVMLRIDNRREAFCCIELRGHLHLCLRRESLVRLLFIIMDMYGMGCILFYRTCLLVLSCIEGMFLISSKNIKRSCKTDLIHHSRCSAWHSDIYELLSFRLHSVTQR